MAGTIRTKRRFRTLRVLLPLKFGNPLGSPTLDDSYGDSLAGFIYYSKGKYNEIIKQWWYINGTDTLITKTVRPVGFRSPIQFESLLHSKAECGIWIGEQVDKTIRHLWAAQWGLTLKTIHYERQVMQTNYR